MRISDWSSDVCSSDLIADRGEHAVQVEDLQIAVAIVKERRVQAQPVVEQLGLNPQLEGIDLLRAVGIGGQRLLGVETAALEPAVVRDIAHDVGAKFLVERYAPRSEAHTSELKSLMRISYDVFCLKQKTTIDTNTM